MKIHVTDLDGKEHTLEALEGWRVMEIIRDHGLPIKAECGGCLACATCQVCVAPERQDKLIPPTLDETDMLDMAVSVQDNSRLSCQLIMTPALDGLRVTLAPAG